MVVSVVDYSDGFEDSSYRGRASAYATANYLARVIYLIKKFGFISASKAREDMCQATYEAAGADFDFLLNEKKAVRDEFYRSEEHTSELQSLMRISYAVFCLKKKNTTLITYHAY